MSHQLEVLIDPAERGNGHARTPDEPRDPVGAALRQLARYWWVELAAGVLWVVIAAVVLKFDHASVVTVGVLTGLMFLLFAAEQFAVAAVDPGGTRWIWAVFGSLTTIAGIVALAHPVDTFAGLADILGFIFLLVAVQWIVQAFVERVVSDLWWLTLISGVLMVGLAFWISGEFFLDRAYTLLVFAGIWAAIKGVSDIVRAFQIRRLGA
jgi:hypothetical protein